MGCAALALLAATGCSTVDAEGSSGPTIKIGAIVQEEGLISVPEVRKALDAYVAYQNKEKDGIGGTPVEIVYCASGDTTESAVACAQEMVNNDEVHVVIEETTNPVAVADALAKGGKAMIAGGSEVGAMTKPGVFVFDPGTLGIADAMLHYAVSDMGLKRITVFHADDPTVAQMKPVITAIAGMAGLDIDAFVPLGLSEADLTGPISSGVQDGTDGLVFIVAQQQCVAAGQALKTLGVGLPVIGIELCLTKEALASGAIDGWHVGIQSSAPVVDGEQDSTKLQQILDKYGDDAEAGGRAGLSLGEIQVALQALEAAGAESATDESVLTALSTFKSSDILGFDDVACPGPAPLVGACNPSTQIIQVKDGEIHNSGGFVKTDFSALAPLLGG